MIDRLALALLLALALFSSAARAQAPVCVPPEEPWMPVSHADLQVYANLIAADFERYFSALTRHLQCLEAAWQDGIERSRTAGAEREAFAARAKGLVLGDKLGVESLTLPERLE